jgi:hypothetical protein
MLACITLLVINIAIAFIVIIVLLAAIFASVYAIAILTLGPNFAAVATFMGMRLSLSPYRN